MSKFEIALYIWGVSNIIWLTINAFVIKDRIEPSYDFGLFFIGLVVSPIYAIATILIFYIEFIKEPLFRER